MYVVIVGGGRVGTDLTRLLLPEGHDIVLMESSEDLAEDLAKQFDALIIRGDGTNLDSLKDAGVNKADVFVSVTGDDNANLISCQLAKRLFKVPTVIGRVNDPKNEGVFSSLGIDNTVSTTRASAIQIKNNIGDTKTLLTVGGRETQVIEFTVADGAPVAHQKISSAGLPRGTIVADIMRGDRSLLPDGETVLRPGDIVTVLARLNTVHDVKKMFEPKKRFGII